MRSSKSRARTKANRNRSSVGNVINRVFDSSGPEGKVRGTPQQIIEKYNQLARDAQLANDRVAAENFQQHAEHYLRLLAEAQREQDARREELEKLNRERQAERDRERAEREAAQADAAANDDSFAMDEGADQNSQSDLVATPESTEAAADAPAPEKKPRKPRAPRKPRVDADAVAAPAATDTDA